MKPRHIADTFPVAMVGSRAEIEARKAGYRARRTGEKRAPKRGEWFLDLSEAHYARADLVSPADILQLVEIVTHYRDVNP